MSASSRPRRWAARLSASVALLLLAASAAPAFAQCTANPNATIAMPVQSVPDQTGTGGSVVVTLDASASTPAANSAHQPTFLWTQAAGDAHQVTLTGATSRVASFVAPDVSGPTTLHFSFRIVCGSRSDTATATVNITDVVLNAAPHAAISVSPALIAEGDLVTLDGSGSYDIDNTPNTSGLTYQWTQLGADGLPVADGVLLQPDASNPVVTFVAPNDPSATNGTTLHFRLTVSDGTLEGTAETPVVVAWTNDPPFAHIACPAEGFIVDEGDPVVLDGSGSFDHDDGIASYLWTQLNGTPDAGITGTATPIVEFNAPALGLGDLGALHFQLEVKDASAADGMGLPAIAQCTVFVNDVTAPVLSLPADMTLDADSAAGTEVPAYALSALDNVDGDLTHLVACVPPAPHLFPLGDTDVACSVADSAGNEASGGFKVSVADLSPPQFDAAPSDIAMQGDTVGGANVAYDMPTATDKVDADVDVACVPPPGFFALGTTPVACTATDDAGHVANAGFNVTVFDFVPPEISGAADQTVEATSSAGAVASFAPTASDVVDDDVQVQCDHASGATFPLGATLVSCSATDDSGNTALAGFTITVVDTTAPTIAPHDNVVATATSAAGAVVEYDNPAASDLVDGDVATHCTPESGSQFALGATTVNCTATDNAGNSAQSTFTVTVRYAWTGFFRPIDNGVINSVKAGSAVPVKFSLGGNMGLGIFASGYPRSAVMHCAEGTVEDAVEETVNAGGSSLQYDATANQYIYVWKTEKSWAGTCRQLQLKLADGTTQVANFKFK